MWGLLGMTARRARTQIWVLLAALLSVLAASTALTTIAAFASATREQTVLRTVEEAGPGRLQIEVSNAAGNLDPTEAQAALSRDVRTYLPELAAQSDAVFYSQESYSLLGAAAPPDANRFAIQQASAQLTFWASEQAGAHTQLLQGRLPKASTDSSVEVAVSQAAAAAHHLSVGSSFPFSSYGSAGVFTVVGIYRLDGGTDRFAGLIQRKMGEGLPLLIDGQDFNGATIGLGSCAYLVLPDLNGLTGANLAAVSSSVSTLTSVLAADQKLGYRRRPRPTWPPCSPARCRRWPWPAPPSRSRACCCWPWPGARWRSPRACSRSAGAAARP